MRRALSSPGELVTPQQILVHTNTLEIERIRAIYPTIGQVLVVLMHHSALCLLPTLFKYILKTKLKYVAYLKCHRINLFIASVCSCITRGGVSRPHKNQQILD